MIQKHLDMKELKRGQGANTISLMTIHRAKGLEFSTVYLIGASENILPHITALDAGKMDDKVSRTKDDDEKRQNALEEERRLTYVAITRAKEELYISSPAEFRGKNVAVSRFLLEAFGQKPVIKSSGVLVWICESPVCNGWQRINSDQEKKVKKKECPICKGIMKHGRKAI